MRLACQRYSRLWLLHKIDVCRERLVLHIDHQIVAAIGVLLDLAGFGDEDRRELLIVGQRETIGAEWEIREGVNDTAGARVGALRRIGERQWLRQLIVSERECDRPIEGLAGARGAITGKRSGGRATKETERDRAVCHWRGRRRG